MTVAKSETSLDLAKLLEGPRSRGQLGATEYACKRSLADGTVVTCERPAGGARGTHYKLTSKGRRRANKAAG